MMKNVSQTQETHVQIMFLSTGNCNVSMVTLKPCTQDLPLHERQCSSADKPQPQIIISKMK